MHVLHSYSSTLAIFFPSFFLLSFIFLSIRITKFQLFVWTVPLMKRGSSLLSATPLSLSSTARLRPPSLSTSLPQRRWQEAGWCKSCSIPFRQLPSNALYGSYRQLRARRALSIFKDVPLRTRRALSLYKAYGNSALLVLNGTSLNSDNTLLALNWRYDFYL